MRSWILSLCTTVLWAGAAGALPLLHADDGTGNLNSIDRGLVIATDGGDVTTIGSLGGGHSSVGLAYDPVGNVLYGVDAGTNELLQIDPSTGAATAIGGLGFDLVDGGLAWATDTSTLYLSSDALYEVDVTTGAATSVGVPFVLLTLSGLDFDSTRNVLVGVDDSTTVDSSLWEINRTTGLLSLLGSLGVPVAGAGLAYDPTQDVFWITDNEIGVSDNFYVVDATGGSATRIGGLSQQTGSGGLAFVPEPGTGLLTALGLGLIALRRRR
jgi:hypothetical protein